MGPTEPAGPTEDQTTAEPEATGRHSLLEARDLALGGLFGALGIVVPVVFHAAGPKAGPIFLPMYLPILALGLLASWQVTLLVACITPLLSGALTGMPPPPTAVLMVFELGILGATASLARSRGLGIWPASILAIIAARIVGIAAYAAVGHMLGFAQPLLTWVVVGVVTSWPGVVLQLTVVPGAVYAIEQTSMLGPRWQARRGRQRPGLPTNSR